MYKWTAVFLCSLFFPSKMNFVRFSPTVVTIPTPVIPDELPPLVEYDSDYDSLLMERKVLWQKQKAAKKKRVDRTRLVKSVRFAEPRAPPAPMPFVRTLCMTCHTDINVGCDCVELVAEYGDIGCAACSYSYKNPYGMLSHSDGRWVECWGRFVIPTCSKCSPMYVAKRNALESADTAAHKDWSEWEYEKLTSGRGF
jgi:hypothetical protein